MNHAVTTAPQRRRITRLLSLPWWAKLSAVLIVAAALFDVEVTGPRVSIRWRADISAEDRVARERRYGLRNGEPDRQSPTTWQYELANRSRENIGAIVNDAAAEDTHYMRAAVTACHIIDRAARESHQSVSSPEQRTSIALGR